MNKRITEKRYKNRLKYHYYALMGIIYLKSSSKATPNNLQTGVKEWQTKR